VAADARSPLYGNLPTFRDNGIDLVIGAFHGVYVPKGTPPQVTAKLTDAVEKAMGAPELAANMNDVGAGIVFLRGQPAKDFLAQQDATYRTIIENLGLRVVPSR
jgi:tripartite-type tricarboxylate transporter receptor subunit TctC